MKTSWISMTRSGRSKPAAASKAGSAKPSAAQQQEQDNKPAARRPPQRKRAQTAAAAHLEDDSDSEGLLPDLEDADWGPTAADSEDELADDFLASLADEVEDSQEESDQEAAACQTRRERKGSAR